jgi:hypothetical protein
MLFFQPIKNHYCFCYTHVAEGETKLVLVVCTGASDETKYIYIMCSFCKNPKSRINCTNILQLTLILFFSFVFFLSCTWRIKANYPTSRLAKGWFPVYPIAIGITKYLNNNKICFVYEFCIYIFRVPYLCCKCKKTYLLSIQKSTLMTYLYLNVSDGSEVCSIENRPVHP